MKRLALGRRAHSPYEVRRPALELALEPVLIAVQPREPVSWERTTAKARPPAAYARQHGLVNFIGMLHWSGVVLLEPYAEAIDTKALCVAHSRFTRHMYR